MNYFRRAVSKLLTVAADRPLPPPSALDRQLAEELRATYLALPRRLPAGSPPSESLWLRLLEDIRAHIEADDPRHFLRWNVVQYTMCVVDDPYLAKEIAFLQSCPDWEWRWRPAIEESSVGHPLPYPYYRRTSGNLIHHAYHIAQFETHTGRRVDEASLIFEFGGGYGSMCRLIHRLGFRGRYVIYDFSELLALQRFYLRSLGLPVDSSIDLVDDLEDLRKILSGSSGPRMFMGTWSISETPRSLRDQILPLVRSFDMFLIAYAWQFEEMNNVEFFTDWSKRLGGGVQWHHAAIEHLPKSSYLIGAR